MKQTKSKMPKSDLKQEKKILVERKLADNTETLRLLKEENKEPQILP